jgi:hypothetical protein
MTTSIAGVDTGDLVASIRLGTGGVWCDTKREGQLESLRRLGLFDAEKTLANPTVRDTLRAVLRQMIKEMADEAEEKTR